MVDGRRLIAALLAVLALPAGADGDRRVLRVGPGAPYTLPSAAAAAARDGDRVEIAAGRYAGDVAVWRADDLEIVGTGRRPLLDARGTELAQLKAIWVIQGDDVRVENIEFANARSPDRNGGGVRSEGRRLVVERCLFRDSETGLLAGVPETGEIVVRASEFVRNGHPDGQAHNIYIGRLRSFTLQDSHVHGAVTGSQVKSRALVTRILRNRIADGADGNGNYLIDISNGGLAEITGNVLQQGRRTGNRHLVAFAPEGSDGRPHALRLDRNTLVNDLPYGVFVMNRTDVVAVLTRNRFVGAGWLTSGPARFAGNVLVQDWPWSWWPIDAGVQRLREAGFVDAAGGNYRLRVDAPGRHAGAPDDAPTGAVGEPQTRTSRASGWLRKARGLAVRP